LPKSVENDVDIDVELVAAKKTKVVTSDGGGVHENKVLLDETLKCRQMLEESRTACLPWHKTLIERQLAWINRLAKVNVASASTVSDRAAL
jgi:CHAD domain-containing protein